MKVESDQHVLAIEDLWMRAEPEVKGLAIETPGTSIAGYLVKHRDGSERMADPRSMWGSAHWDSIVAIIPVSAITSELKSL